MIEAILYIFFKSLKKQSPQTSLPTFRPTKTPSTSSPDFLFHPFSFHLSIPHRLRFSSFPDLWHFTLITRTRRMIYITLACQNTRILFRNIIFDKKLNSTLVANIETRESHAAQGCFLSVSLWIFLELNSPTSFDVSSRWRSLELLFVYSFFLFLSVVDDNNTSDHPVNINLSTAVLLFVVAWVWNSRTEQNRRASTENKDDVFFVYTNWDILCWVELCWSEF